MELWMLNETSTWWTIYFNWNVPGPFRTFHYSGLPFNHSDFFAETPGPRGPLRKVINHDNKANCISLRTHKNTQAEPIGTIGIRTAPRSSYDRLTAFIALPEGPLAVHHPDSSLVLDAPSKKRQITSSRSEKVLRSRGCRWLIAGSSESDSNLCRAGGIFSLPPAIKRT